MNSMFRFLFLLSAGVAVGLGTIAFLKLVGASNSFAALFSGIMLTNTVWLLADLFKEQRNNPL